MNHPLLKKTFIRTLKWYPLVLFVMIILGIAISQTMEDPVLAIGLMLMGAIVGPALEAVFYYQEQLKRERRGNLSPANEPANRLRQAAQLLREGLIREDEYEHTRQAILTELSGERRSGKDESEKSPAQVEIANAKQQYGIRATANTQMKIHPWLAIMVALSWPMIGFLLALVLEKLFKIELSKLASSGINLVVGCFGAFYLFPKIYRAPFGLVPVKEYLKRIGFYLPPGSWRHMLLGIILAGCTLSGMLVASLLTGRYEVDWSTINLSQTVFSINPGLFEELFYRGLIMMLLLHLTKSLKKATVWQIVIFGLAHIKGFDGAALIDIVSVMVIAIAFTYAAYKTRALLAGIVFHFLHDAFLFFVQVPGGSYHGLQENLMFYSILWLMVGVGCFIIWFATEHLNVRGKSELYIVGAA